MRWGIGRDDYRVKPGLYALGTPVATSPVLVTGNYKMTLDECARLCDELDAWLLVVDTRGINVWCAAGKGTFCADEVARMVVETRLAEVVDHRRLDPPAALGARSRGPQGQGSVRLSCDCSARCASPTCQGSSPPA